MTTEEFIRDIIPLQPAMQRMAEQILRNSDDAADAVQETLARLWHRRFRLGLVKDKRGYCLNALRNNGNVKVLSDIENQLDELDVLFLVLNVLNERLIHLQNVDRH